ATAATLAAAGVGRARLAVAVIFVAHAAGLACFFRGELVCIAGSVGCLAAFAGDLTLLLRVHRSEATVAGVARLFIAAAVVLVTGCHDHLPFRFKESSW